jgi:azurin
MLLAPLFSDIIGTGLQGLDRSENRLVSKTQFSIPTLPEEVSINAITMCGNMSISIPDGPTSIANKMEFVSEKGQDKSLFVEEFLQEKPTLILLEIVPELMKFDKEVFTVTAGNKVVLELDNLDGMEHNLLILKPGTLQKVGTAADAMLRDPKASEKFYVPAIPEVLFSTKMLGPNEVYTLNFTAPSLPGDYPFVCTFPGHWRMMNGIMRVVKP